MTQSAMLQYPKDISWDGYNEKNNSIMYLKAFLKGISDKEDDYFQILHRQ